MSAEPEYVPTLKLCYTPVEMPIRTRMITAGTGDLVIYERRKTPSWGEMLRYVMVCLDSRRLNVEVPEYGKHTE